MRVPGTGLAVLLLVVQATGQHNQIQSSDPFKSSADIPSRLSAAAFGSSGPAAPAGASLRVVGRCLEELRTPADAGREISAAPEIEQALEAGVDITLLVASLRLTPYERLRRHAQQARFRSVVQARTVPAPIRANLERLRLEEKVRGWGLDLDQVLEPDAH